MKQAEIFRKKLNDELNAVKFLQRFNLTLTLPFISENFCSYN